RPTNSPAGPQNRLTGSAVEVERWVERRRVVQTRPVRVSLLPEEPPGRLEDSIPIKISLQDVVSIWKASRPEVEAERVPRVGHGARQRNRGPRTHSARGVLGQPEPAARQQRGKIDRAWVESDVQELDGASRGATMLDNEVGPEETLGLEIHARSR